jgi:hypothetical protein
MKNGAKGKLIDEIFGGKCEGNYVQPTLLPIILWR